MMMISKICSTLLFFVVLICCWGQAGAKSIVDSLHNLSVSGPGTVKATGESEICIFCHTPHGARSDVAYLWNRRDTTTVYTPYISSTLKATVGQPTGSSRLCLSCHDGTIAPGAVISRSAEIPFGASMTGRSSNLGTNLADDHPVSFDYIAAAAMPNSQLKAATSLPSKVRLDADGQMQCTACHNPHNDQYGKFLVMSGIGGALCISCHQKTNWSSGSHALSTSTWNGTGPNPWPRSSHATVADNACGSCHRPHSAAQPQRLLNYSVEETTCLVCHSGTVAAKNILTDLNKPYRHPVFSYTGVHDPAENYSGPVAKHVECVDCHNPHQANSTLYPAPLVPGRLQGVPAVTIANSYISAATYEYEVYHPVMKPLNKITSGLLVPPWTTGSMVFCTDCHGSDSSGIRGSHGSIYPHILVKKYETSATPAAGYDLDNYALCFSCHNATTLRGPGAKFPQHGKHLDKGMHCTYCHDPHGNPVNPGMINFDVRPGVTSESGGKPIQLKYPLGGRNSCVLTCHGKVHGT